MRSFPITGKIVLWFAALAAISGLLVLVSFVVGGNVDFWLVAALFATFLLFFLASLHYTRGVVRRWNMVVQRLESIARGRVNAVEPPANLDPELLELWDGLERVAAVIDRRRNELENIVRDHLESEITAEKQQLEAFLRGIGDGVSIVDPNMNIVFMNDTMRKIFGDHVGDKCYRVYENKKEVCPGCPVRQAMLTGEVHHSLRRVYDQHGNLLYYESTGSPIRDHTGRIIAGLELARDATQRIKLERNVEIRSRQLAAANAELRRANEQLARAYEELQQAQIHRAHAEKMASLGVLVSGVAHEINNPLNFVAGSQKLLQENVERLRRMLEEFERLELGEGNRERLDELKKSYEYDYILEDLKTIVRNIGTGAARMKQIVQNLRAFSRMDRGQREEFNVCEGIESTLQILHHQYKDRITIERDYRNVPPIICTPGQINQVFMNILHNAIQALEGAGRIVISVRAVGDWLQVSVADDGPGIADDDLLHVFDPFFTTKKVGKGTGLGLSISYGIVQDHGGRLWVESEQGNGSTFHLKLPLNDDAGRNEEE
ncbi:MAG: ATP-binding protein [Candidatus Lernaella stagnicola]|nr:ATP-binding protein [Candidatus Lernaella stagnicola]